MRIFDIMRSLAFRLNEAGDPGQNPSAQNKLRDAKGGQSKKNIDNKRARKPTQAPGAVEQSQEEQEDGESEEIKQNAKEQGRKRGTSDAYTQYGTGTEAQKAADEYWDDASDINMTVGQDRERRKQWRGASPKVTADTKDNQAHGFDNTNALNEPKPAAKGEPMMHGETDVSGPVYTPDGRTLRYYSAEEISNLANSGEPSLMNKAQMMAKNNQEYMSIKNKNNKEAKKDVKPISPSEKEDAATARSLIKAAQSNGMKGPQIRELLKKKFGLDEKGVARLIYVVNSEKKADVNARNKESFDNQSVGDYERSQRTGTHRAQGEVTQLIGQSKKEANPLDPDGPNIYSMGKDDTNALALQAKEGNSEAQKALFKKTVGMLYKASDRLGSKFHQDRADLYGEAKVALMNAFKKWNGSGDFTGFLSMELKNAIRDYMYGDSNVQVERKMKERVKQVRNARHEATMQGLIGGEVRNYVKNKLGLSDVEYDSAYNLINGETSTHSPVGDEGDETDLADTVDGHNNQNEYTASDDMGIGTGASPEQELDSIRNALFGEGANAEDTMKALYADAGVEPQVGEMINDLFGIGGREPAKLGELSLVYGLNSRKLNDVIDMALRKMARSISRRYGSNEQEMFDQLQHIKDFRDTDYSYANMQRRYDYDSEEDLMNKGMSRDEAKASIEANRKEQASTADKRDKNRRNKQTTMSGSRNKKEQE